MIPREVMAECRARARRRRIPGLPVNRMGAAVIVVIWVAVAALLVAWGVQFLRR